MARLTIKPTELLKWKKDDQEKNALRSASSESEIIKKVSKSVWFLMEPEAGKWPEICLLDIKNSHLVDRTICSSTPLKIK